MLSLLVLCLADDHSRAEIQAFVLSHVDHGLEVLTLGSANKAYFLSFGSNRQSMP